MFTNLKPYPEYRDTGVQWFDQLPSRWESSRLRGVSRMLVSNVDKLTHEDEVPVRLCNYVDVYRNDFISDRLIYMRATATLGEIEKFRVRTDDVVITKDSESWTDIGVPAYVMHEADDLLCGYHLAMLRTRKDVLSGSFLFRALQVPSVATQFHVAAGGVTRYGLSHGDIRAAQIPLPSLGEQAAIVKYLGHANARIDRTIAAKRKLIALLEEQKQAIINQAVTRGLDATVPLKDARFVGLDEIPSHWQVPMLGRCLRQIEQGWSPSAAEGELEVDQWAVLSLSAVSHGRFNARALKPIPRDREIPVDFQVADGDLLMTRSNTRLRVGDVAIATNVRPRTIISDLIYRLSPRAAMAASGYLALVLRSRMGRLQIERDARGSSETMPKISQRHIRAWRIPLPPLAEQVEIVQFIDEELRVFDEVSTRASEEIELLREFRTRLTADVVTGQLDVRAAAARLPELDPSELMSDIAEPNEDDLDVELAESLEEVDA